MPKKSPNKKPIVKKTVKVAKAKVKQVAKAKPVAKSPLAKSKVTAKKPTAKAKLPAKTKVAVKARQVAKPKVAAKSKTVLKKNPAKKKVVVAPKKAAAKPIRAVPKKGAKVVKPVAKTPAAKGKAKKSAVVVKAKRPVKAVKAVKPSPVARVVKKSIPVAPIKRPVNKEKSPAIAVSPQKKVTVNLKMTNATKEKPPVKKAAVASPAQKNKHADKSKGVAPYQEKPNEEYMNDEQVEHFRHILLKWKRQLMEEVDRTVHHMQDEAANFPDPNDRATQEEEFSLELRARDRERKLIRKIEEALQKIESNEYGYCDACGIDIGIRRLEARPTASLCIDCKTLDEIKERQMGGNGIG